MRYRLMQVCTLFILLLSLLPTVVSAQSSSSPHQQQGPADFPTVEPDYIYNQLFYMVTHYQHREAGYDNNLSVDVNGHDEFATYWAQEMSNNLQGFGPRVRRDDFPIKGWVGRPAAVPTFNVEVSVPGVTHPEQVVVIGCHYDGEAISTQSANDDASGCAIELGVAKAMATYWRSQHLYPARTLRFVIFDAEEQGLFGSFHYLNSTINGDVHNLVAMFNEEQNGIAYPLRYLGKTSYPLLPFFIEMSPLKNSTLYRHQSELSQAQRDAITHFRALMQQAVPAVFAQFQALGFQTLTYHGDNQQDVSQPIFTPDQQNNVRQEDDMLGGSDQIPFTLAGLPCATFVGNTTYYNRNPPQWSYPYDQKEDTIQLMNIFASGSSRKAQALILSLALPGMLTTWMLHQPDILGEAAADNTPIAAMSDVGIIQAGHPITLDAKTALDPTTSNPAFTYDWSFGDGATANGDTVTHIYTNPGNYTLMLTVSDQAGKRSISKTISVVTTPTSYQNLYANYPADGNPPRNPAVTLPQPNDNQPTPTAAPTFTTTLPDTMGIGNALLLAFGIVAVVLGCLIFVGLIVLRRQQKM